MNILIVDDQYDVVQGLMQGVDWQALGADALYPAYSVEQAIEALQAHPIHVALCDIELPPRRGFEVLDHIRAHNLPTQLIFLTAHARFDYAQTAVKMGSFDYLLQPASYEEIARAVERAAVRFREAEKEAHLREYGRYWQGREALLLDSCLTHYLTSPGQSAQAACESLDRLRVHLQPTSVVLPVLLQGTPRKVLAEALRPCADMLCLADMGTDGLLLLLKHTNLNRAALIRRLGELCAEHARMTCYPGQPTAFSDLPIEYARLTQLQSENVAGYRGVVDAPAKRQSDDAHLSTDMRHYESLLMKGEWQQVRAEALSALQHRREQGRLDAAYLLRFHRDFTQAFLSAARTFDESGLRLRLEAYPYGEFLNACSSYEKMVALVEFACGFIAEKCAAPAEYLSPVEDAVAYIRQHVDQNLSCQDIADAVHLNASHLTRLFKREKGVTLNDFITAEKMRVAASLLRVTAIPVSIVAVKVGYTNFSYFSQVFRKYEGMTPQEYRRKNHANVSDHG